MTADEMIQYKHLDLKNVKRPNLTWYEEEAVDKEAW